MATYSYTGFREVLNRLGFTLKRSRKHETWEKETVEGNILQVRISHQRGRDIPRWLFQKMLRQADIKGEEEFVRVLRGRK